MVTAIPESRSYIHATCSETTELTDSEFKIVASPLPGTRMTMCAVCGRHFPVAEFRWAETGEDLPAYYARHAANVSASSRWMCSSSFGSVLIAIGFLAGIGVGIWLGIMLGIIWGVICGIVAVFAGMLFGLFFWDWNKDRILKRCLNVPDMRCLK